MNYDIVYSSNTEGMGLILFNIRYRDGSTYMDQKPGLVGCGFHRSDVAYPEASGRLFTDTRYESVF